MEQWIFCQYNVGDVTVSNFGVMSENKTLLSDMLQSCIREHGTNFRTICRWF